MIFHQHIRRISVSCMALCCILSCSVPKPTQQESIAPLPTAFQSTDQASLPNAVQTFPAPPALQQLIDTVLAGSPDLRIASQRLAMARAVLLQTRGLALPTVNANLTPSMRRFGLYTMDGAGNKTTEIEPGKIVPVNLPDAYLGFQASWEVDLWGKLRNRKRAAAARLSATEEGQRLIRTALVAETATAYYELVAADHTVTLLEQAIQLQEQALDMVRVQKQAARVNELAVQQFEAQLLEWKSLREEALRDIGAIEGRLRALAGTYELPLPRDTARFVGQAPPVLFTGVPADLLRRRPDLRQAEWELMATRADVSAARAAFFPSLQINAGVGLQSYSLAKFVLFPESLAYGLFAGLSAPLLNRSQLKGDFALANAAQREAYLNYGKQVNRAFQEVRVELNRIGHLEKIFQFKKEQSALLQSSTSVSDDLFRTGRASYLEVLLARQNALRANLELIGTRRDQYLSAVNLYRALGGE